MQISKTIEIQADPATVWNALTNPEETKKYFFGCEAISDWNIGSTLDYQFEFNGRKGTAVTGEIRAIEPAKFMEVTCRGVEAGVEGDETVATYTLTPTEGGTQLAVTQGEFTDQGKYDQTSSGWDLVLGGLKTLVEG
ncbi:MAG: hypothetical protein ACI841_000264 [Planctomycetota bacterium]|jgi:uncharacterized protein YndB with AHSA1/START domain